jgi:hypothetical protein
LESNLVASAPRGMVTTLPESGPLPNAGVFAECFLLGTRQSRLCREPHSAKYDARQSTVLVYRVQDTRHRTTLGKDLFAECQTLGKEGARQRAVSGRHKADGRQPLPRAEGWNSAKRLLCRVPRSWHSANHIFVFYILATKLFVVCYYTM